MTIKCEDVPQKKPWAVPKVERIQLELEEVILAYCKRGGVLGPFSNNCSPGHLCPRQGGS